MARRNALRGDQWKRIEQLLPGRFGSVGATANDDRLFIGRLYKYMELAFRGGTCLRVNEISV